MLCAFLPECTAHIQTRLLLFYPRGTCEKRKRQQKHLPSAVRSSFSARSTPLLLYATTTRRRVAGGSEDDVCALMMGAWHCLV